MYFKRAFQRLHHDSLESNLNRYGKPAKIITIIKALYQGWAHVKETWARGKGLHRGQCQTRWCLTGQVICEIKVRMEPWAVQQPFTTLSHVMKYLQMPECPDTSKRGFIVGYEKKNSKCNESLNCSLLSKATAYRNRGSLYIWQWKDGRQLYQKLARSSCVGQDGIWWRGAERTHDEIFEVKWYFPS